MAPHYTEGVSEQLKWQSLRRATACWRSAVHSESGRSQSSTRLVTTDIDTSIDEVFSCKEEGALAGNIRRDGVF